MFFSISVFHGRQNCMYEVFFSFVSNKLFLQMRILGLFLVNIINSLEDITIH